MAGKPFSTSWLCDCLVSPHDEIPSCGTCVVEHLGFVIPYDDGRLGRDTLEHDASDERFPLPRRLGPLLHQRHRVSNALFAAIEMK